MPMTKSVGGGMLVAGGDVTLERCIVANNTADWSGGIFAEDSLTIANCTIVGNWDRFPEHHGSANWIGGDPHVTNSILWDNGPTGIRTYGNAGIRYSDVEGGWPGVGNINADPLFLAAGTDSMRLHSTSPCRDTGDPTSPLDPDGSRADMGARPFDPTLTVENPQVPARFLVLQNAPNPFNPTTTIRFTLPEAGQVRVAVYDVRGALTRTLVDQAFLSGAHSVVWDGKDWLGRNVASGVYVYRLTTTQGVVTKRMTLLR
jgi:hypothetical protein